MPTITKLFRAPYATPNGLQLTPEGLWIVDQITDRVALVDPSGASEDYGVPKLIRDIPTESSNTSGLTYGDGSLWLAANGSAHLWRPPRPKDALAAQGEILRVDPRTGATQARYPVPGGGGVHGIEYDPHEAGMLWVTTLKSQTVSKVRIEDWSVQAEFPVPLRRAHGLVRRVDGLWVVHTGDRVLVKLDPTTGVEVERIHAPEPHPEPHGLSVFGADLVYCDATSGWVARIWIDLR